MTNISKEPNEVHLVPDHWFVDGMAKRAMEKSGADPIEKRNFLDMCDKVSKRIIQVVHKIQSLQTQKK